MIWLPSLLIAYAALGVFVLRKELFSGHSYWSSRRQPGFWGGLCHGFFFLFVAGARCLDPRLNLYEPVNQGLNYDLGFFAGVALSVLLVA